MLALVGVLGTQDISQVLAFKVVVGHRGGVRWFFYRSKKEAHLVDKFLRFQDCAMASTRYGRWTDVTNEQAKSKYRSRMLYFSLNLADDSKCSRVNTVLDMMN